MQLEANNNADEVALYGWDMRYGLWPMSQIGSRVDIVAPGTHIYSTSFVFDDSVNFDYERFDVYTHLVSIYETMEGTSMAGPHVTGVVGMIWNVFPELSGAEVKRLILDNTLTHNMLPANVAGWSSTQTVKRGKRS